MLKIAVIALIIFGGLFAAFLLTAPQSTNIERQETQLDQPLDEASLEERADIENKPTLLIGDENAPVKLIEYADFKCTSCSDFHQKIAPRLKREYIDSGRAAIEYRTFPFIGPDSGVSARAAYCAQDQGAFESLHDAIYDYVWKTYYSKGDMAAQRRDVLTLSTLKELASGKVNDIERFDSCINSDDYNRFIDADLLLGAEDGITGTPGFVIGDQSITGLTNYNTLKTLIDIELSKN